MQSRHASIIKWNKISGKHIYFNEITTFVLILFTKPQTKSHERHGQWTSIYILNSMRSEAVCTILLKPHVVKIHTFQIPSNGSCTDFMSPKWKRHPRKPRQTNQIWYMKGYYLFVYVEAVYHWYSIKNHSAALGPLYHSYAPSNYLLIRVASN